MWQINKERCSRSIYAAMVLSLSSLVAACVTSDNPLDDYEALTPTTNLRSPEIDNPLDSELAIKGRYLVELLGCGTCHTDGALIGEPNEDHLLAGSQIGIAYTNPLDDRRPGVVFPANLTPDMETGIGGWTQAQLMMMIRRGVDRHGTQQLSVMPWPVYAKISDQDAMAIAAYLQALAPVKNNVPMSVYPGQSSSSPFVHFGVYRSRFDGF